MPDFTKFAVGTGYKIVPRALAQTVENIASQTAAGRPTSRSSIDPYTLQTLDVCGVVDLDGDMVTSSAKRVGDHDFASSGRWR